MADRSRSLLVLNLPSRLAAPLLSMLMLAGCATNAPAPLPASSSIDWEHVPIATLRLDSGFFHPQELVLARGRPVRLVFANGAGRTHDFVTAFFSTTAQRGGTRRGGVRVILQPTERVTYDLVPEQPGTFQVITAMFVEPGRIPPAKIIVR